MCVYQEELRSCTLAISKLHWWPVLFLSQLFLEALTVVNKFSWVSFSSPEIYCMWQSQSQASPAREAPFKGKQSPRFCPHLTLGFPSSFIAPIPFYWSNFNSALEVCISINNGRYVWCWVDIKTPERNGLHLCFFLGGDNTKCLTRKGFESYYNCSK